LTPLVLAFLFGPLALLVLLAAGAAAEAAGAAAEALGVAAGVAAGGPNGFDGKFPISILYGSFVNL
jgi:hypothetical protein